MNEQSATPDEPTESSDLTAKVAKVAKDTWRSWGRNLTVTPAAIVRPENTDQVEQVLRDAAAQGLRVRPAGSGQSFSPLVPTSDVVLDATALTGLSSIDVEKQQATFFGGTTSVTGLLVGLFQIQDAGRDLRACGEPLYTESPAVAVAKDNPLKADIDEALQAIKDNGTYADISNKWFGEDIS